MDSNSQMKRSLRELSRNDRSLRFIPESWLHILKSHEIQSAKIVATYLSYGVEPQTLDINQALIRSGKIVLLPRTLKDKDIEWVIWDGSHGSLRKNGRTQEPIGDKFEELEKIEVVIVPALQIDRAGNRMGQGGGSYDRALARLGAWKVGLVGAAELTSSPLPVESHDQKVDAAATPEILVRFNRDVPHRP
jgi:5-formyltetrahydrofolate cyclo-ligase